jgi:inhibitor of cysteine peptidase
MLVIDETQNNGAAEVLVGAPFRVQLSENPTTGYRWHLLTAGAPALHVIEDSFQASRGGPGSAGVRYWIFVADHPVATALRMELRRSWQPQPVDSFSFTVNVASPSPSS